MIINEYAFKWRRAESTQICYYQTKKSPLPFIIVCSNDPLRTANDYIIYKVNTTQFETEYKANRQAQMNYDDSFDEGLRTLYIGVFKRDVAVIKSLAHKYPWLIKIFNIASKPQLYKTLVDKMSMKLIEFQTVFGEIDQTSMEESGVKFHNTFVLFPDSMREDRRKSNIAMLEKADVVLNKAGFGYLLEEGRILFKPLTRKVAGLYYAGPPSEIWIDSAIKWDKWAFRTIIHELGHKLEQEFFTKTDLAKVVQQYSGAFYAKNSKVPARAVDPLITTRGTTIEYLGRKRKYKENSPYQVTHIPGDPRPKTTEISKVRLTSTKSPFYIFGSPSAFANEEWKVEGQKQERPDFIKSDSWFPTEYSKTNPSEWFCDLFSYHLLGLTEGEPKEWLDSFLDTYRKH